jgi:Leucine-rich repeat (LRR) protein
LEKLPENIGNLQNLEQITLYQNNLTRLPKSFSMLQSLEKLNLSWNNFESFPEQVSELKRLEWLACFYNPNFNTPDLGNVDIISERPFISDSHLLERVDSHLLERVDGARIFQLAADAVECSA